jgi:hypothetical protein
MGVKPSTFGPWIRGVDASTGVLTQPKGSIPRGSNLVLSKRGSLRTCDGTQIVDAFNGVPTPNRGRAMAEFFFAPTGVAGYYLRIMNALDQHLGPPKNLAAVLSAAPGSLTVGQPYYWVVTAVDGAGGETTVSNEVTLTPTIGNQSAVLTWASVPNAFGYNIYRGTSPGSETLLFAANIPVRQGTLTYTDSGTAATTATYAINSITCLSKTRVPHTLLFIALLSVVFPTSRTIPLGANITYTPGTDANFTGLTYGFASATSNNAVQLQFNYNIFTPPPFAVGESSTGGSITITSVNPPLVDKSQQTALYAMPPAANGIVYTNANIVALFPAPQSGGTAQQGYSPSGGIAGSVNLVPQMAQFTNQAVLALGNGFPPQVYSDATGTPTNPATSVPISSISVDAFGVVTVTTSAGHNINLTQGVGANVIIAGVTDPAYNTNGNGASAFVTTALPSATSVKFNNLNALGHGASSGGTLTVSTIPIISTFVPSFPQWTASVSYAVNSIIVPTISNGHYYKAIQGGTSGTIQPTFPTGTGAQIADGQVIWREAGLLNTAAPPPPGCAHLAVFSGSLWVFNTYVSNTATGLDGPCSLRMSDVNNLNSWNPINQAFLDKDDGTEGLGLASFTIAAQGIPPEGSLCAFKKRAVYQIVGVFGASNFAIQRVQSDMGVIAPRTLQFVPGFGIVRLTYLGFAVFDGVNDRIVSTQVEPYLIGSNDPDDADIIPMDQQWQSVCQSALTANPPMYVTAIPTSVAPGGSVGALTTIMSFDLVLKAWAVVDLPFPISTIFGAVTYSVAAQTVFGSFNDGTLQQWQAANLTWATSVSASLVTGPVAWSMRTPGCTSKDPDERLYLRRVVVVGQQTAAAPSTMTIEIFNGGASLGVQNITMPVSGDFQVQGAAGSTGRRFYAVISGQGLITIDSVAFDLVPRPVGVMSGAIS